MSEQRNHNILREEISKWSPQECVNSLSYGLDILNKCEKSISSLNAYDNQHPDILICLLKRLRILHQHQRYSQLTNELSISVLLQPSIIFLYEENDKDPSTSNLHNELFRYIRSTLFHLNSNHDFLVIVQEASDENLDRAFNYLKQILNTASDNLFCRRVCHFCCMLLIDILQSKSDKHVKIYHKLITKCCSLFNINFESGELNKVNVEILYSLLNVPSSTPHRLEITGSAACQNLKKWLNHLIDCLLTYKAKIMPKDICSSWYKCISSIIKIDPSIVISKLGSLFKDGILINEDEAWTEDKSGLFCDLVKLFFDLRQIPKFFLQLLTSIKDVCAEKNFKSGDDDSFIPDFAYQAINVSSLPLGQLFQIWQSILASIKVFESRLSSGENNGSSKSIVKCYVTSVNMLSCFLSEVRFVDNALPNVMISKLQHLMKQTCHDCLCNGLHGYLNEHKNAKICYSLLKLANVWGELELILHHYSYRYTSCTSLEKTNTIADAHDLCSVHSYISPDHWKQIFDFGFDESEPNIRHELCKLLLQKIRAFHLFKKDSKISNEVIDVTLQYIHLMLQEADNLESKQMQSVNECSKSIHDLLAENLTFVMAVLKVEQLERLFDVTLHNNRCFSMFVSLLPSSSLHKSMLETAAVNSILSALSETLEFKGIKRQSNSNNSEDEMKMKSTLLSLFDSSKLSSSFDKNKAWKNILSSWSKLCIGHQIIRKLKCSVDVIKGSRLLKVIQTLPVEFLTPISLLRLLLGVIVFYVICIYKFHSSKKDFTSSDVDCATVVLLILSSLKNLESEETYLNFSGTNLLNLWTNLPKASLKTDIADDCFSCIMRNVMRSKNQFTEIESFISKQNEECDMSTRLLLMDTLNEGIVKNIGSSKLCRNYFWILAQNFLSDDCAVDKRAFKACRLILDVAHPKDKFLGTQTAIPEWKDRLRKIIGINFDYCASNDEIDESLILLASVWNYRDSVMELLPKKFVEKCVDLLVVVSRSGFAADNLLKQMLLNCSNEEYVKIVKILEDRTVKSNSMDGCGDFIVIWTDVLEKTNDELKLDLIRPSVIRVFFKIFNNLQLKEDGDITVNYLRYLQSVLRFVTECCTKDKLVDSVQMIHSYVQMLQFVPFVPLLRQSRFDELFSSIETACELINVLLVKRAMTLVRSSPALLSCINHLFHVIILAADQDLVLRNDYRSRIISSAELFKRLLVNLVNYKQHVDKLFCCIISQYVASCHNVTLLPAVKNVLLDAIYACLSASDLHTINHLRVALNPSSREIFKSLHNNFINHYKYKGKV